MNSHDLLISTRRTFNGGAGGGDFEQTREVSFSADGCCRLGDRGFRSGLELRCSQYATTLLKDSKTHSSDVALLVCFPEVEETVDKQEVQS